MKVQKKEHRNFKTPQKEYSNEELVIRIKTGIDTADNMALLWQQNRGIIHKIANRYQRYESIEDLEQEGFIGLCKAVERYDSTAGTLFITYAAYWIKQAIFQYLEDSGRIVRIPKATNTMMRKYKKLCVQFELLHNRAPSENEIGRFLKVSREQVGQLLKDIRMEQIGSLDTVLSGEVEGLTVGDTVVSPQDLEEDVLSDVAAGQLKDVLWDAVDRLDEKWAAVIRCRFQEDCTLEETGTRLGITGARVRQIQISGIRELKKSRVVRQFGQDYGYIQARAYHGSGLTLFKRTWTSSTEGTALELIERETAAGQITKK